MSEKVSITFEGLRDLLTTSQENGTERYFGEVAIQWAEGAAKEIDKLRTELVEAQRDADYQCRERVKTFEENVKLKNELAAERKQSKILKSNIAALEDENNKLRVELAEVKNQIRAKDYYLRAYNERSEELRTELVKVVNALQQTAHEKDDLTLELAAERKKREEVENLIEGIHDELKMDEDDDDFFYALTVIKENAVEQLDRANRAEAQVEVLREHMTGWLNSYGWRNGEYIDSLEEYFSEVLANLPAEAEKAKAVLEAADYWYEKDEHEATDTQECLKEHPDCATCRLIEAVRERRLVG